MRAAIPAGVVNVERLCVWYRGLDRLRLGSETNEEVNIVSLTDKVVPHVEKAIQTQETYWVSDGKVLCIN